MYYLRNTTIIATSQSLFALFFLAFHIFWIKLPNLKIFKDIQILIKIHKITKYCIFWISLSNKWTSSIKPLLNKLKNNIKTDLWVCFTRCFLIILKNNGYFCQKSHNVPLYSDLHFNIWGYLFWLPSRCSLIYWSWINSSL